MAVDRKSGYGGAHTLPRPGMRGESLTEKTFTEAVEVMRRRFEKTRTNPGLRFEDYSLAREIRYRPVRYAKCCGCFDVFAVLLGEDGAVIDRERESARMCDDYAGTVWEVGMLREVQASKAAEADTSLQEAEAYLEKHASEITEVERLPLPEDVVSN
jgi:hypothetical protein